MIFGLKQFVPADVCSACRGCCSYACRDSVWSPLFLYEEIVELTEKNIVPTCLFTGTNTRRGGPARIDIVEDEGEFICPCFNRIDNRCKIYINRPFECRLYPFLLGKKGEESFLGFDDNCPYAHKSFGSDEFKAYVEYLINILSSSDFLKLVKNNPEIMQDYSAGIKYLSPL